MMVTFISQCEKKALNRSRRVLDAFANRIGDNSWQTVITDEGLLAVKKLLRKTASKNTAVSCHWIRSRSRSELIWVVGRKTAFNHYGFVPVNFTSKEVIMDKLPIETSHLLANTKSQPLNQHLFAVGMVACYLLERMEVNNPKLMQAVFIAGVLHDIGKIDPEFQRWVSKKVGKLPEDYVPEDGTHIDAPKKFSFENHPRHHELSWLLTEALLQESSLNASQRLQISHGIYWHHTKPFRKDDKFTSAEAIYGIFKKTLADKKIAAIHATSQAILKDIENLATLFSSHHLVPTLSKPFSLTSNALPLYKKYDDWLDQVDEYKSNVKENALNNLVRAAVISADRLVSSCSAEELEEYLTERSLANIFDRNAVHEEIQLTASIEECLTGFETRYPESKQNKAQSVAAKALADLQKFAEINESANIGVLQGPAGCGKTKIALEWAQLTEAKKIIWVCPRVQVCLGLLNDLTHSDYLPNSRVEIFTGEYKKILSNGVTITDAPDTNEDDYFSGDIVLTTIDQVINSIRSHSGVDTFVQFMQAHVVFDEFHELVNMTAFNLLFAELIHAKKEQGAKANTLLVSATPHYFFLKEFLEIEDEDIISIDSFNSSRYRIEFQSYDEKEEPNPLISKPQEGNTFVITNTAQDAQLGYLLHHGVENSVLLHSKYTKQDKTYWFNQVFDCFKRNGDRRYDVLRSGPIVQASLNISCDQMMTELTCAENWLQRLGRLDRFGVNSSVNRYITILPESIAKDGKQTNSCARFLNQLCTWQSTKAWLNFLQEHLNDRSDISINELYKIYQDFYANSASCKAIEADFLLALKKSVSLIKEKVIDPISVPPKSRQTDKMAKISANSLRGDNRFVQMAVCNVSPDLKLNFVDRYAYEEELDPSQLDTITASVESMRGYGEDDNNLVQFMRQKHHNIKSESGYKKAHREWDLIKEARSPETPIYLSYTPNDLEPVGGIHVAHPQAVYYVTSDKQPVGAISIAKLKQQLQTNNPE